MSDLILFDKGLAKKDTQKIETDIFNYRSKELFINLKESDIPPKGHPDRDAFIDYEEEKCLLGVTVNGIFIPPTFYWDFNHWAIMREIKDSRGIKRNIPSRPDIRDNDWMIHKALWECENVFPKENLVLGTGRQSSKSKNIASIFGNDLMLHDGRINLLMAGAEIYLTPILEYLTIGTENCTDFFRVPRLTRDKKSKLWKWGFKTKEGEDIVKSMLHVRNAQEGKNTEVAAGVTIHRSAIDEIATFPVRSSYETILPALVGENGIRSSSLTAFTGGSAIKSKDAEEIFYNPRAGRFKEFENEGKKTGFFLGGWYRQDLKEVKNFGEWLGVEDKTSELYDLNIRVTNLEKSNKILDEEEALAAKSSDPAALIKHKMYNPRQISDMFLTENKNPFNIPALQRHKEYLLANPVGTPVELYRDIETARVMHTLSSKKPIPVYPVKDQLIDLDAPIVIYDFPKYQSHYGLHCIGFDPISQDKTKTSDSLASIYVVRRNHTDVSDGFREVMVASYTARPGSFTKVFMKNVELLQEFYNAQILHEVGNNPVFTYFDMKRKTDVLMNSFSLQKSINPNSNGANAKGMPANPKNNAARLEVLITYLEEDIEDGKLGLTRILDPLLIDELIAYDGMGEGTRNTDRIDAFTLALLQITSLERFNSVRPFITHKEIEKAPQKKLVRDAFGRTNAVKFNRNVFGY